MLYIVSTPIGNIKDITFRAVETLKNADEIACEDTRRTLVLLREYGIDKPLVSYHKFNERAESEKLAERIAAGKNVALVTDAGTPLISDPGSVLVRVLAERGLPFTVVPGATAFVCALVMSGLLDYRFDFIGFLPEKQGERQKLLAKYAYADCPLVFYCAPHDVAAVVSALYKAFGNRKAVAVREITKIYETRTEFTLADGYCGELRGEFVIIVEGADPKARLSSLAPSDRLRELISLGEDKKTAVKTVAKEYGVSKNEIYKLTFSDGAPSEASDASDNGSVGK